MVQCPKKLISVAFLAVIVAIIVPTMALAIPFPLSLFTSLEISGFDITPVTIEGTRAVNFTITNAGNADISGIEISMTGPLSGWLTLEPLAQTALGPGQQTSLNALLSIPADAQPRKYIGHIHLSANPGIQPAQIMIEVDASG